jgi:hypothetical protein
VGARDFVVNLRDLDGQQANSTLTIQSANKPTWGLRHFFSKVSTHYQPALA